MICCSFLVSSFSCSLDHLRFGSFGSLLVEDRFLVFFVFVQFGPSPFWVLWIAPRRGSISRFFVFMQFGPYPFWVLWIAPRRGSISRFFVFMQFGPSPFWVLWIAPRRGSISRFLRFHAVWTISVLGPLDRSS
jgi:hypothetical protein